LGQGLAHLEPLVNPLHGDQTGESFYTTSTTHPMEAEGDMVLYNHHPVPARAIGRDLLLQGAWG